MTTLTLKYTMLRFHTPGVLPAQDAFISFILTCLLYFCTLPCQFWTDF